MYSVSSGMLEAEMKPYDTRIMAWAPLAQGDPDLLTNPILTALAERYDKTVQQIALRYLVQRASSPSRKARTSSE